MGQDILESYYKATKLEEWRVKYNHTQRNQKGSTVVMGFLTHKNMKQDNIRLLRYSSD